MALFIRGREGEGDREIRGEGQPVVREPGGVVSEERMGRRFLFLFY